MRVNNLIYCGVLETYTRKNTRDVWLNVQLLVYVCWGPIFLPVTLRGSKGLWC